MWYFCKYSCDKLVQTYQKWMGKPDNYRSYLSVRY